MQQNGIICFNSFQLGFRQQTSPVFLSLENCFNSFQLGFRLVRGKSFGKVNSMFQFLLVRLQTLISQMEKRIIFSVSIPFSQALDSNWWLQKKKGGDGFNSFQLGFRLFSISCAIFSISCFNSFQLGFRPACKYLSADPIFMFQFLLVRLQTFITLLCANMIYKFQFLLVRLQTERQGKTKKERKSFNSFQLGFRL